MLWKNWMVGFSADAQCRNLFCCTRFSKTGGSRISRSSDNSSETTAVEPDDWRTPLVCYLENPGHIADKKNSATSFKICYD
jgi:hypothetical protein